VGGSLLFTVALSVGERFVGRRALLSAFTLALAVAVLALALTRNFAILAACAFVGSLTGGEGGGAGGPHHPLEQASIADTAGHAQRTNVFAVYGIMATVGAALGALASGLPELYGRFTGWSREEIWRITFLGFVALLLIAAFLYTRLSRAVEGGRDKQRWSNPFALPSRRRIFGLTALFSVDRFGGALIMQSLVAYWFSVRFGMNLGSLAFVFFAARLLSALSLWLSARIAGRIGLINTMVFTHIPASLLLIGAAFAPTGWLAVVLWQLRSFLGMMDVPARDSYTMAIVHPEERVAMGSIHIVGRSMASMAGPPVATALWNALSAGAPFIACGVVKIVYDITLFGLFRGVRPPEEEAAESRLK
jgi:MFS family permease